MRIKIDMEMSGNQFLDIIRQLRKAEANAVLVSAKGQGPLPGQSIDDYEIQSGTLWKSAQQLIDAKKK